MAVVIQSASDAAFTLRPATAEDTAAIIAVICTVYQEYGFIFEAAEETPDLLALDRHYDGRGGAFFIGTVGGAVAGTVGVRRHADGAAEIVRLYLDSRLRGRGYGQQLLHTGLGWAHAQGARRVRLWSDSRFAAAHRLYTRYGFLQAGQRQLQDVNYSLEYQFVLDLTP